jgi:hypothetical protein
VTLSSSTLCHPCHRPSRDPAASLCDRHLSAPLVHLRLILRIRGFLSPFVAIEDRAWTDKEDARLAEILPLTRSQGRLDMVLEELHERNRKGLRKRPAELNTARSNATFIAGTAARDPPVPQSSPASDLASLSIS